MRIHNTRNHIAWLSSFRLRVLFRTTLASYICSLNLIVDVSGFSACLHISETEHLYNDCRIAQASPGLRQQMSGGSFLNRMGIDWIHFWSISPQNNNATVRWGERIAWMLLFSSLAVRAS
jgi:hypothetical protein